MISLIKSLLKTILSMPTDLFKMLKNGNLDFGNIPFFLRHPYPVKIAVSKANAVFRMENGKRIMSFYSSLFAEKGEGDQISFWIDRIEQLMLVNSCFYGQSEYKINLLDKCDVIDIGMNMGDSSLFFALNPNICRIYGFEPFKETYEYALFNFGLNKELAKKIEAFNYGLSDCNKTLASQYNVDFSMHMRASESQGSGYVKSEKNKENVILKAADEILGEIISKSKNKIILKIDCEGEEYEILKVLNEKELFKKIDYVMLENHYRGQKLLLDILRENQFITFSFNPCDELGMIYGIKESKDKK
jgi:FkbM family methyltransferase